MRQVSLVRSHRLLRNRILIAALAAAAIPAAAAFAAPVADYTKPAARDAEPVILTGKDFAGWAVPENKNAKLPGTEAKEAVECYAGDENPLPHPADPCATHNHYADPEVDTSYPGAFAGDHSVHQPDGPPVDRLLGYRWTGDKFEQIPFQVDEVFTRYLDNTGSGFSFYSGEDQHTTYAYDREGFRWTQGQCVAEPDSAPAKDPIQGLDTNDELVFMASDAGGMAPVDAALPAGIEESRTVAIADPTDPATQRFVYVMKAAEGGPEAAFDADNGYVSYERDAISNRFEKSESSYEGYGNAATGPVCDADGNVVQENVRRRPRDYATITTDRYRFRYDGRWLLTELEISPDGGQTYGPDLIDRWKARAFAQDPASETPCCGYEEEDTNWGGSSTLLGERVGPVRAIRETWGADSGTNVIRRETFYRDEMRQKNYLRVHVIPPLDGIYAQWDFNAGRVTRFYTSAKPEGVDVDGKNDEIIGNFDDPCNGIWDRNDTSDTDQTFRETYRTLPGLCTDWPYHQSVDVADPTLSELNSGFQWSVTAGPDGSIVDRYRIDQVTDLTPGGAVQQMAAVPYYRDDSCFDDGTGTDPGPRVRLRSSDETMTYTAADGSTQDRKCWEPSDGIPDGSQKFFQGDIATHGLHILFLAESDNARQTVPVTEIVGEQRLVMLTGERGAEAGEQYGRSFEKPLVAAVLPR